MPVSGCVSFDDLLQAAYEGPLEDEPWHTFLADLCTALPARAAVLTLGPSSTGDQGVLGYAHWPDDVEPTAWQRAWADRLFLEDPLLNLPPGEPMTAGDRIPAGEHLASRFYREFMEPLKLLHVIGIDGRDTGGLRLRASRGPELPDFGASERALLRDLLPHLERAARLHRRMSWDHRQQQLYTQALERLGIGVVVLDDRGRVTATNGSARKLLAVEHGLQIRNGQLAAARPDDDAALRTVIHRLIAARSTSLSESVAMRVRSPMRDGPLQLVLRALPFSDGDRGHERPAIAVFLSEPRGEDTLRAEVVRELFGLTPSEAALATSLVHGQSLAEAATELSISRNTARNHLQSIFSKLGISRQSELVGLLLRSVAHLG